MTLAASVLATPASAESSLLTTICLSRMLEASNLSSILSQLAGFGRENKQCFRVKSRPRCFCWHSSTSSYIFS